MGVCVCVIVCVYGHTRVCEFVSICAYVSVMGLCPNYMGPYLETGSLRGNQIIMRSLGWALIQYGQYPYKMENF